MDITWTLGEPLEDRTRRTGTITITLTPEDDPDGHVNGLLTRGRLEAFLAAYPRAGDSYAGVTSQQEAYDRLARFAFVAAMCASRLEGMQLAARDQWGMGWGTIASAVEASRSTVKDQVLRARAAYIQDGAWYDASGLHTGTPAEAYAATENTAALADGED